jgi:hypothetical protein
MIDLTLKRIAKRQGYTIGRLYINNQYFCDTLEDEYRGLTQDMTEDEIKSIKIKGRTAIPSGTYVVRLDIVSNKFSKKAAYKFIGGKVPRLINVPGYSGILIHIGNDANDTEGCILVGRNTVVGKVLESTKTFKALMKELYKDKSREVTITII